MNSVARLLSMALVVSGCGGGDDPPPVELAIDAPVDTGLNVVILTGTSFVPPGSHCPQTGEFIEIGSLGPHTLSSTNETTGGQYPVGDQLWVCNSGDGRRMSWISNPIALIHGDNTISVTMTAAGRKSSASVVVLGRH